MSMDATLQVPWEELTEAELDRKLADSEEDILTGKLLSQDAADARMRADLMYAEAERAAGYRGRTGDEVVAELRQIISDAKRT